MNSIKCPTCGTIINIEEALFKDIENNIKIEYDNKLRQQQAIIFKEKEKFEQEKLEFIAKKQRENEIFKEKLEQEKQKIHLEEAKKAQEEINLQLKALAEENEKRKIENLELKKKELEFEQKERYLKEKEENLNFELQKKLLEDRKKIEQEIAERENTKFELLSKQLQEQINSQNIQIKQQKEIYEKMMKDQEERIEYERRQYKLKEEQQIKLIEDLKRKAGQGSMQIQGEVPELILEELLKSLYVNDKISEVPKGIKGADVIQVVMNNNLKECGKIIYESKNTKNFSEEWIKKLNEDKLEAQAAIAIIVTAEMPKGMTAFGERNGVWICSPNEIKQVSFILREMLIREYELRISQEDKGDKMSMLYNYLTTNEFKQRITNIFDAFKEMKSELDHEKRAFQKIWKEREVQIERILNNAIDIYSTFTGIAGKSIPQIPDLQLLDEKPDEN